MRRPRSCRWPRTRRSICALWAWSASLRRIGSTYWLIAAERAWLGRQLEAVDVGDRAVLDRDLDLDGPEAVSTRDPHGPVMRGCPTRPRGVAAGWVGDRRGSARSRCRRRRGARRGSNGGDCVAAPPGVVTNRPRAPPRADSPASSGVLKLNSRSRPRAVRRAATMARFGMRVLALVAEPFGVDLGAGDAEHAEGARTDSIIGDGSAQVDVAVADIGDEPGERGRLRADPAGMSDVPRRPTR